MTARKKKGVGFAVSGVLFIAAAVVFFVTDITPEWVPMVFAIIGTIAEMLGFKVVYPDLDE